MGDIFIKRIFKKPPMLFPLVALFHIGLLLYQAITLFPDPLWIQFLYMVLYTFSWLFICDMKKWAALVYIALTTLNLVLRFVLKSPADLNNFTDALFPADVLFTFFVMFYFRRFE